MVNNYFWAKKDEKNGRFFWLPLYQHLEDTKNIIGLLWEHWLCEGQRKLIEKSIVENPKCTGKKLVMFLGAVHDIGKATPVFQSKKGYINSEDLDNELCEKLERSGFNKIVDFHSTAAAKTPHNIAGQYLLLNYGVSEDIAVIIGGHHGKPVDELIDIKEEMSAHRVNYFQSEDETSVIYKRWEKEQGKILKWALNSCGFEGVNDLAKIKQPAQVILLGLLIMADWIASNERYFPLLGIDESFVLDKDSRYKKAFLEWKKSDNWEPAEIFDFKEIYNDRFGYKPRDVQSVLADTIANTKDIGIIILEAPMGIGKTEASLVAAEQLAAKTDRSGMFFGLPTQATSNGIFPRILNWLSKIKDDENEVVSVRLSHGKAYLNEQFSGLARNINIDGEKSSNLFVNEWFSGRKTASLDDFVVGTIDQFLMTALKQRHLPLRHLGFSKKVVILDEVHAYDAYMSRYLMKAIEWMGAYGVPVMLLSATLPENRRIEIIENYMMGMGIKLSKEDRKKRDDSMRSVSYPLITYNDGSDVKQIRGLKTELSTKKQVIINRLNIENLEAKIAEIIVDGGVIGIIVNTVKKAQIIGQQLSEKFGEETVEVMHSSFISNERIKKEERLLNSIGKSAQRPDKKIIVGTQVIEQSLDIDFDVMISDLAPMDLLVQRVGRLHRHKIHNRPKKHLIPTLYVMGLSDSLEFEGGSLAVYGGYLLTRTQFYLPEVMNMPEDIPNLVQKVYGFSFNDKTNKLSKLDDIKFESSNLHEKYMSFFEDYGNEISRKQSAASKYRILAPVLKQSLTSEENLIGWLQNPELDLDNDFKAYAQVRDIDDSIEVIALKQIGDGYGMFDSETDISGDICDDTVAKRVAQNTLVIPRILTKQYNIDETIQYLENYNTKNLGAWRDSVWLKGALGIIFDKNNEFIVRDFKLRYDEKLGLSVERISNFEKI